MKDLHRYRHYCVNHNQYTLYTKESFGEKRVRFWQVWINWEELGQTSTYGGTGTWAIFQRHESGLELEHCACVTK